MSTRDFSWGKDGRCVWLTTYNSRSAEREEIWGLNLPRTPWATLACCGRTLPLSLICQAMGLFCKYVVLASLVHHTEYKYMLPK